MPGAQIYLSSNPTMNNKFINLNDLQPIKIDKSFKGWLKEDSLARFIVEIVNQLDMCAGHGVRVGG